MFDFPNSPTLHQTAVAPNGSTFVWDGAKWINNTNASGLFLPTTGGTMQGPLNVTATGGNTVRSVQDHFGEVCNVKDFGAKGDARGTKDAAMTAGGTTLTSATLAFTAADVGKTIMVFGTGTSGATQQGTVIAVGSATTVTTSFVAVTTVAAAAQQAVWIGTDDTAAVTAAIAASRTRNTICRFPPGCYWLASQSAPIPLTNITLQGDGKSAEFFPYNGGSTLLLNNTVSPAAFSGVAGTILERMTFFYPQVNAALAVASFPPLFQADNLGAFEVNNWFMGIRIVNAWQAFHSTTQGSWARTWMTDCFVYGIDAVFYMQSGYADVLQIENCYFGIGPWPEGLAGSQLPRVYTQSSGAVFRLDIGAGNYNFADGLIMTNSICQFYRYGIQLISGTIDVSNISNVNWDGVRSILYVTGTSRIVSTAITGGEAFCSNSLDGSATADVFHFDTSGTPNELTITGMQLELSQGNYIWDNQGTISRLVVTGNTFQHWGKTTTTGTYYAFACPVAMSGTFVFSGNLFWGDRAGTSNSITALFCSLGTGCTMEISGNNFSLCTTPIFVQGSSGVLSATGNLSTQSGAPINDASSGTALAMLENNNWDIKPVLRAPTISGAGTGAAVTAGSSTLRGQFTTGSGTVTSGTITFATPLPYAPVAVMLAATTVGAILAVTSISASAFQWSASASIPSVTIFYDVKM